MRLGLPSTRKDDENAHRKRINSKTLSKVDKFENAVYAPSCGGRKED